MKIGIIILLVLAAWFASGILFYLLFYIRIKYFTKISITNYSFIDFIFSALFGLLCIIFHIMPDNTFLKNENYENR